MAKNKKHLVIEHLEKVSSEMLENHFDIIRDYIKDKNGIYALYSGDKLYYVGLAMKMSTRLKQHLKDRHAGLWNRFSLYLTRDEKYLNELESLFLNIYKPKGNKVKGKLRGSTSLKKDLYKKAKEEALRSVDDMFGRDKKEKIQKTTKTTPQTNPLFIGHYIDKPLFIKRTYKGVEYKAKLKPSGYVLHNGKEYSSPRAAAMAITNHRNMNGLIFWKYKDENGDWVPLKRLKEKKNLGKKPQKRKKTGSGGKPVLAPYITKGFAIRAKYKGRTYRARVLNSGTIRYNGKLFKSPSGAGKVIKNRDVNGWVFWQYQKKPGVWAPLSELKRGHK